MKNYKGKDVELVVGGEKVGPPISVEDLHGGNTDELDALFRPSWCLEYLAEVRNRARTLEHYVGLPMKAVPRAMDYQDCTMTVDFEIDVVWCYPALLFIAVMFGLPWPPIMVEFEDDEAQVLMDVGVRGWPANPKPMRGADYIEFMNARSKASYN